MFILISSLLMWSPLLATAGEEGDLFCSAIWQAEDGSYRFVDLEAGDINGVTHVFSFENPKHAKDCPCKL